MIVRQREIAEGDEDYGTDSDGYGLWIADVERPAPENRDGYQPYLDDADDLLTESCRPSDHVADDDAAGAAGQGRARASATRSRCSGALPARGLHGRRSGRAAPARAGRARRGLGGRRRSR